MSAEQASKNGEMEVTSSADVTLSPDDPAVADFIAKFKGFDFLAKNPGLFPNGLPAPHPPEVERRLKALKNMQVEMFKTECAFYEELHELELKYASQHLKLCSKRSEIVTGKYEPTDEECRFDLDAEETEEKDKTPEVASQDTSPVSGIPKFWLIIFQNVDQFNELIGPQDLPALEHLEDVTMELTKEPMGFKLYFHFSPNEFFSDEVLVKTYEMRVAVDPKDPFSFEGTEIFKSTGCPINWKNGKDLTKKEVKKKQKHKATGAIRLSTKIEACPSFFDFFNPHQLPEENEQNEDDQDPEIQDKITLDFELGSFLKERLIPRAVLYFTGEALESDDEDEEEEEEDEFTDASGEEEEGDEEEMSGEEEQDK